MFCSLYLHDIETVHSRPERNYDAEEPDAQLSVFAQNVRACGGRKMRKWSEAELSQLNGISWTIVWRSNPIKCK